MATSLESQTLTEGGARAAAAPALAPVLDAELHQQASRITGDLACALVNVRAPGLALGSGLAGQLLFCSYHARAFDDSRSADLADVACAELVLGLRRRMPPALYGGFAGLGWTLAHVSGGADEWEGFLTGVDAAVAGALAIPRWEDNYDLISGLTGLGIYALERHPLGDSARILQRVLYHLEQLAVPRDVGHAWLTPPAQLIRWQREIAPNGYYNLGLSHGVPGVIVLLAACIREGAEAERAHALLEPAMRWLLSRRLPPSSPACFPTWEIEGGDNLGTRLAWCYGDPGTAVALLAASQATGRQDWREVALEVAHWAARPDTNGGVIDASICHGAFGLAHIFHRLYLATHSHRLWLAARRWAERAMDMQGHPEHGLGGYRFYHPKQRLLPGQTPDTNADAWVDDPGLLMGSAGAGLTLLSLLDPELPSWDLPLLTALDTREPAISRTALSG